MQWHQLNHMQIICTSLQTDNHTNTSSLNLQAGCSSWRQNNSVKAPKAKYKATKLMTNAATFQLSQNYLISYAVTA